MLGLKEFVSIDSVKAHLVDILEENRRLKKELEENRDKNKEWLQREKKQKEVALIEAEEWKKRAAEKDKEIQKLQEEIDRTDKKIEELTSEKNHLITEREMAKSELERALKLRNEARDAGNSLKYALERYHGADWERTTKTALIKTLKIIMKEAEEKEAEVTEDVE